MCAGFGGAKLTQKTVKIQKSLPATGFFRKNNSQDQVFLIVIAIMGSKSIIKSPKILTNFRRRYAPPNMNNVWEFGTACMHTTPTEVFWTYP